MCRPSNIDSRCEIRLLYLLKTLIAVCELRRGFALPVLSLLLCRRLYSYIHVPSHNHLLMRARVEYSEHLSCPCVPSFATLSAVAMIIDYYDIIVVNAGSMTSIPCVYPREAEQEYKNHWICSSQRSHILCYKCYDVQRKAKTFRKKDLCVPT